MEKIKWGIISTGRITHQFASDISNVSNAELSAVASRTLSPAKTFAKQYSISKAYGSYLDLYDDPEIDAVYVATPHSMHLKNASDAMLAGKAVLCEKPLTVNSEQSATLIALAKSRNTFLMEGMWTYFLPAVQKAFEWVNEGRIGNIEHIKVDFGYPQLPYDPAKREYNPFMGGGCLLEMGVYPVALAWLFSKQSPLSIKSVSRKRPNGVVDDFNTLFEYEKYSAVLGSSFRCKLQNWAYIIGQDRYIAIPDFWKASECLLYELDECVEHFKAPRRTIGFNYEIESVSKDLLMGKSESSIMPLDYSQKIQEHMDAINKTFACTVS